MISLITYLSALLSLVPFVRPDDPARRVVLWPIKVICGAATPILGLLCGLGALRGALQRDWKLAGAGIFGLGLVLRFLRDLPVSPVASGAGPGLPKPPDAAGKRRLNGRSSNARVHQSISYGPEPAAAPAVGSGSGRRLLAQRRPNEAGGLLADIWEPETGVPRSGLGVVYVHGGGWRIGDKDMGTRTFFRRLTGQGHVIMDISYGLWPEADLGTMVGEVKRAVLWLKGHSQAYGLDPARLVLMGNSAGAHLALLAAYTPGHPNLPPAGSAGDTSVCGVVAFYPPIDLHALWELNQTIFARKESPGVQGLIERTAEKMLDWTFALPDEELDPDIRFRNFLTTVLGGEPDAAMETYRLLSPSSHVGPHCPPTLLLQGRDDVFQLAPDVRQLRQDLEIVGVPAEMVEYPHAEHAFDLVLPTISPLARAAAIDVDRFLASLH